jgi:ACT domain-containing protein
VKLKIVYSLKDYEEALRDVGDVVDKSLINVSLIKANNCRKVKSGVVILLTMDRKLREKLHDLISKIQLINHILIPNISLNTLDKCLDTECFIRCVLQGM